MSSSRPTGPPSLLFRVLVFGLTTLSLVPWFSLFIGLLAWALWIGDHQHSFFSFTPLVALVPAVGLSTFVDRSISRASLTKRQRLAVLGIPLALFLSFIAFIAYEELHRIEGWTAEQAAQNVLRRLMPSITDAVELVEREVPKGRDPNNYKVYWIMGQEEPRGRITLYRHPWFGWGMGSSEQFSPSADELRQAFECLEPSTRDTERARLILDKIIDRYPGTKAEAEAKQMLERIEGDGRRCWNRPSSSPHHIWIRFSATDQPACHQ